ncbi:hypothetical protein K8S19_08770 [bacterium]|nr:hypothetical protein [bacterium]
MMKKIIYAVAAILVISSSGLVHADITNDVKVDGSTNIAVKKGSKADMGTIRMKNGVSTAGGDVTNKVTLSKQALNVAVGENSTASMGSISLKGAKVSGQLNNNVNVKEGLNVAVGEGSNASMGSINIENSRVTGKLTNKVEIKSGLNVAVGKNSTSRMGSIDLKDGYHVGSTWTNNVEVDGGAMNIAVGEDSEANMGAIVGE